MTMQPTFGIPERALPEEDPPPLDGPPAPPMRLPVLDPPPPFAPPVPESPAPAPHRFPSLGRIVRVLVDPALNNGDDVASALVVKVTAPGDASTPSVVDLRLLLNAAPSPVEWATARSLWPDEETARNAGLPAVGSVGVNAFWPVVP